MTEQILRIMFFIGYPRNPCGDPKYLLLDPCRSAQGESFKAFDSLEIY